MTLVLACLTRDVAYQISDRRLTSLAPPYAPIDDEANKVVVVSGRVAFSYAGLAQIGTASSDERTDFWLTRVISSGPTDDMAQVAERIRVAATEAFAKLTCPAAVKRHAFQGVGWFRLKGESAFTPGIITIDNAVDHQTGTWLPEAKDEFMIVTQFPTRLPGSCILNSVGKSLNPHEKRAVVRFVRKCVKHRSSTPSVVGSSLVTSLQWLSSRYEPDSPIGKGLMLVSLPRRSVEHSETSGHVLLLASTPSKTNQTFLYVSATGSVTYFGPHFVMGRDSVTGFQARSLPRAT